MMCTNKTICKHVIRGFLLHWFPSVPALALIWMWYSISTFGTWAGAAPSTCAQRGTAKKYFGSFTIWVEKPYHANKKGMARCIYAVEK